MASAVVTSVSGKLGNLLIQEAKLLYEVDEDVKWIQTQLTRMQCFLKDADSRQNKEERVKNWVKEIIQVSYDAEDIVETFIYSQNALRRRRGFAEWIARCVCIVGELVSELITQYMVSKKIKKIRQKINDISESRKTFGIRDINEDRQEESSSISSSLEHWQFYADVKEEDVVGQKNEISTLREQLISEEPSRCLISIVGMPGSGKTTLAKKVYHVVKDGFPCHAFVTLSQQYKIKNILMDMLKCVMGLPREEMEKLTEKELGEELRDYFKKARYLVVIDDIWSKEAWDDMLEPILPDVKNKSRVILTTRYEKVIPDDPTLRMRFLNDAEGWELFMKKIFPKEKNPSKACPAKLEGIGKRILAKCGGLPLAILVSGGGGRGEGRCCTYNKALLFIKCFAAGVILTTSHVHVLPDTFDALADCQIASHHPWKDFPFSGFIAMVGTIIALLVDVAPSSHVEDRPQYAPVGLEDGGAGGVVAVKKGEATVEVVVVTRCHNTHKEELAKLKQRLVSQVLEIGIVFRSVIIRVTLGMSHNR
ncbi:hypothetical protein AAC387_Pa07g0392 [Persea americana]